MENAKINVTLNPEIAQLLAHCKAGNSIDQRVNLSLVIFLFTERAVTLARAAELASMGIGEFVETLKEHNVVWSEYTEDHKRQDDSTLRHILEELNG